MTCTHPPFKAAAGKRVVPQNGRRADGRPGGAHLQQDLHLVLEIVTRAVEESLRAVPTLNEAHCRRQFTSGRLRRTLEEEALALDDVGQLLPDLVDLYDRPTPVESVAHMHGNMASPRTLERAAVVSKSSREPRRAFSRRRFKQRKSAGRGC